MYKQSIQLQYKRNKRNESKELEAKLGGDKLLKMQKAASDVALAAFDVNGIGCINLRPEIIFYLSFILPGTPATVTPSCILEITILCPPTITSFPISIPCSVADPIPISVALPIVV